MLIFYTSNEDIVDIKNHDGICLLSFVVDELKNNLDESRLFLHPSIFSIIHSRSA